MFSIIRFLQSLQYLFELSAKSLELDLLNKYPCCEKINLLIFSYSQKVNVENLYNVDESINE